MSKPKSIISQSAEKISDNYSENPLTAILLTALSIAVPQVAIGKEAIDRAVTKIQKERFATLLDELAKGEKLLTPEIIESEEFIHSFVIVYRAAINTYRHEKIRRFARILLSAIEENELASDKFEEFSRILKDLSERELFILKTLRKYEVDHPNQEVTHKWQNGERTELENDGMRFNRLWNDLSSEISASISINSSTLRSILVSLSRTGLYDTFIQLDHIYGSGKTTPLLDEFSKWIQLESEKDIVANTDQDT